VLHLLTRRPRRSFRVGAVIKLEDQGRAATGHGFGNELAQVFRLRAFVQQPFSHKINELLELLRIGD
jgi:hypothetical protein